MLSLLRRSALQSYRSVSANVATGACRSFSSGLQFCAARCGATRVCRASSQTQASAICTGGVLMLAVIMYLASLTRWKWLLRWMSDSSSSEDEYIYDDYLDANTTDLSVLWSAERKLTSPLELSVYTSHSRAVIDGMAPNFSGDALIDNEVGELVASDYAGKWVLLLFYPKDFTFVCPTELIAFNDRMPDFEERDCQVIGVSCDTPEVHQAWCRTPRGDGGLGRMQIPLLADVNRAVSIAYGTLGAKGAVPNRGMFLISPEGKLKSMQINMNDVGRSVEEALRLLDAFRYVAEHGVVCPADWKPGEKAMSASQEGLLDWAGDESREQKEDDALPQITSREQFQELTTGRDPVVVDYMASWCGKCRMIAPYVEDLSKQYPDISFYKVDTSKPEFEGLTKELGIEALPAFRFYKGGREAVDQVSGYKKKPLGEAVAKLSDAKLPDEP